MHKPNWNLIIGFTILFVECNLGFNSSKFLEFLIIVFLLLCSLSYFKSAFEEYTGFKIK